MYSVPDSGKVGLNRVPRSTITVWPAFTCARARDIGTCAGSSETCAFWRRAHLDGLPVLVFQDHPAVHDADPLVIVESQPGLCGWAANGDVGDRDGILARRNIARKLIDLQAASLDHSTRAADDVDPHRCRVPSRKFRSGREV